MQHTSSKTCRHPSPFRLDVGARSNVVLAGENKLIVENPLGFVVKTSARMELHNLPQEVVCMTVNKGSGEDQHAVHVGELNVPDCP